MPKSACSCRCGHVAAITAGSEVRLRLGDGRATPAKVHAVVPVSDARSQSFEAQIDVPNLTPVIAVGRSVQVEVPLGRPQASLAVPRDAVVIEGGLKAGEQVIVHGAESLRDGDAVKIVRTRDASSSLATGPATQT